MRSPMPCCNSVPDEPALRAARAQHEEHHAPGAALRDPTGKRIGAVIIRLSLARESQAFSLVAALCSHGFSTRDESTELSGRGVGLSALHAEALALGGSLRIDSEPGQGTELSIELPVSSLEG
jgi:signal transduction histidine kinase